MNLSKNIIRIYGHRENNFKMPFLFLS